MDSRKCTTLTIRDLQMGRSNRQKSILKQKEKWPLAGEVLTKMVEFMSTDLELFKQLGRYFKCRGERRVIHMLA